MYYDYFLLLDNNITKTYKETRTMKEIYNDDEAIYFILEIEQDESK